MEHILDYNFFILCPIVKHVPHWVFMVNLWCYIYVTLGVYGNYFPHLKINHLNSFLLKDTVNNRFFQIRFFICVICLTSSS